MIELIFTVETDIKVVVMKASALQRTYYVRLTMLVSHTHSSLFCLSNEKDGKRFFNAAPLTVNFCLNFLFSQIFHFFRFSTFCKKKIG
jgi:hypothetical protein